MVPERTKSAAGWEVRAAQCDSRLLVVGSSRKTSSKRVQAVIARSIEAVGVVIVSPGSKKRHQQLGTEREDREERKRGETNF